MSREPRSATPLGAGIALALVLAGCGGVVGDGGPPSGGPDPSTDGGELLMGHGLVMQADGQHAELCLGAVATSYPPQCGGPTLVGFEGWQGLPEHESAYGWTWGSAFVVGTYDGETFTLAQPAAQIPPSGWEEPEPAQPEFPQLCEDPLAGSPGWDRTDPGALTARDALLDYLQDYDELVLSYVSDGAYLMNVLVAGDADAARAELREVYAGPLCVAESDLPLRTEVRAAQEALSGAGLDLLSSGSGVSGLLEVQVVAADEATVAEVHRVVSPWLDPEDVVVTGVLQPYTG